MKQNKGFTLVEILVVLAIIAILVAIAIPVYLHMTASADETICNNYLRNASTLYTIKRAAADGAEEEQKNMMAEVLLSAFGASEADGGYAGICPSGGIYLITVEHSIAKVSCSKHGAGHDESGKLTPQDYIQMFLNLQDIELKNDAGKVVSNGTILDYLRWKTQGQPNGSSTSLDSEADHLGERGIAKQIEAALGKVYPQMDFDQNSWRIYYKKGNPAEYTITWSGVDISDKAIGEKLDVIRFDVTKNEYTVATTAKVNEKTAEGKKIKYIDLTGVTDWKVIDPESAFAG